MPPLTLADLDAAWAAVEASPHVRRTALHADFPVPGPRARTVALKLENTQRGGSFKMRGMAALFAAAPPSRRSVGGVTMSAGNAGRAFAELAQAEGVDGLVVMPTSVPRERSDEIRRLGSAVSSTCVNGPNGGGRGPAAGAAETVFDRFISIF